MKQLNLKIFIAFLIISHMASCQPKDYDAKLESLYKHTVPLIRADELAKALNEKPPLILDIRSDEEFAVSHIKNASFIDYDSFSEEMVAGLPRDAQVVVYCSVGYRSEKIGEKLQKLGFKNVFNLYGGIFQWKNDGFEVLNSQGQSTDSVHTYNKSWSKWLVNGVKVY